MQTSVNYMDYLTRVEKADAKASEKINIIGHYDDETLIDKSGRLIKMFKLSGVDFVTKDDATLDVLKRRRNMFLKNFNSEHAVYFWTIRKKCVDYPDGKFSNKFAHHVSEKYKEKIKNSEMYRSYLYFALMSKPPQGFINKGIYFLKNISRKVDKAAHQKYLSEKHQELCDFSQNFLSAFSVYRPEILGVYKNNDQYYSSSLSVLSEIINFEKINVPLLKADASVYLPMKRLFFNRKAGVCEMRAADGKTKFCAVLSIKMYPTLTYQGVFNELDDLKIEYVITQSYRFYDRHETKIKLRDQQKELSQSKDESVSQTEEITDTFDAVASGDVGMGIHHFVMVCYADSKEKLKKHVGEIVSKFSDADIQCVREDLVSECGFWSQLPGNFKFIARSGEISTKNLAAFASLHNYSIGKISGNHWGTAVTVFETLSGSPYYFNFHYKDVGNFLVFGIMGSGKTTIIGFLIIQSLKFGGRRIIFDKDRGLEMMIRALSGVYERIIPGVATGFNPCLLEDNKNNRKFLAFLFKKMLSVTGRVLDERDFEVIENAINGMYRLHESERRLRHIAPFFGTKTKGSLRSIFELWHSDGAHAWLFDNEIDTLNLNTDVIGFDIGSILKDDECKTPAFMYLMYRVELAKTEERNIVFVDEGWQALSEPYFNYMFSNEARTPRKNENIFGMATHDAEDTVKHSTSKAINASSACKIFFPNPTANEAIHMQSFGLTAQEVSIIKTLPDNKNYFLLNYGNGNESVVIRANLKGMEDEIAIISGRKNTLEVFDEVTAEVGYDPNKWIPVFHERRKLKQEAS